MDDISEVFAPAAEAATTAEARSATEAAKAATGTGIYCMFEPPPLTLGTKLLIFCLEGLTQYVQYSE